MAERWAEPAKIINSRGDPLERIYLAIRGQRLRGGRAAVKIRCLLGRSRLRRKCGRLFLRLGRRSESEPPATHLIGLTPSSFFSSVIAVRRSSTHRFWPLRKGDYEWQSTM